MKISRKISLKTSSRRLGLMKLGWMVAFVAAAGLSLLAGQVQAQTFPAGPQDDFTSSLGSFRIFVHPHFRPLLAGYPGFDGVSRLQSPTLADESTVIGRSDPHLHGDAADLSGTPVGSAGTIISDANFTVLPPGFQGPTGTREVHTEVRSLRLSDAPSEACSGPGFGAAVRAGTEAPLQPISPGEVESRNEASGDFPAESFFNVFVEVDLPFLGGLPTVATLYNTAPLLIVNDNLEAFPPRVVYIHGNTEAVPVLFRDDHPGGLWHANDLFGWLVLAGHAPEFTCSDPSDVAEFESFMQAQPEMPLPCVSDGDVNGDVALTPGDALCAFKTFLNNQNLPPDCDVPDFICEVIAADANCSGMATPEDARAIFERYLMALPPEECFAVSSLSKLNTPEEPYQLSLNQHTTVQPAESAEKQVVKISLTVDNPAGLKAFGLKLSYPANKLEFLGVERTALTANWIQLDGQVNAAGVITLGGFHIEPVASTTPGKLFQVLFAPKGHSVVNTAEFELSYLVDNFSDAIVKVDAGSTSQSVASVPKVFELHQNFPNPFQIKTLSSETLIRFDLSGMEAVKVELAIYNVTGQLVRHLISGTRSPGAYEIMWDGKDEQGRLVTSGIYLYRLKAGNRVASKRITVAR